MDNLTHSLVGLAASKAGLEKLSPYTTAVSLLAANAPDIDIVVLLFGDRWTFVQHHRGITHSIVGTLILALALPLIFYLGEGLIARVRRRGPKIKLKGLMIASLIVAATHPFMDWTNNYGIRPLLPLSSQWFYGDFVFIIDPFIWLIVGGAGFLLTSKTKLQIAFWLLLAGLLTTFVFIMPAQRNVSVPLALRVVWLISIATLVVLFTLRASQRWGNKVGLIAFAILVLYWGTLASMHVAAATIARKQALAIASHHTESVTDVAAMPTIANPLQWSCVVETDRAAYRFEISLLGNPNDGSEFIRHERADTSDSSVVQRAISTRPARVFLGFARFPVVRVKDADCVTQTLVQFADLRYTQPGSARGSFALDVPVNCDAAAWKQN